MRWNNAILIPLLFVVMFGNHMIIQILMFAGSATWLPLVIVIGLPIFFIVFLFTVIKAAQHLSKKRERVRRDAAPTLAEWDYTAAEWSAYAQRYGLSPAPKGSAHVVVKGSEISITDESGLIRKDLCAFRRYVADCQYADGLFQIRVRAYPTTGSAPANFIVTDISLPVPPLGSASAARAAAVFNAYIAEEPHKDVDTIPNYDLPHSDGAKLAAVQPGARIRVATHGLLMWALYLAFAGLGYFVVMAEIITGDIPSKSGPAAKPAAATPTFFWIFIAVEAGLVLYVLGRGLYMRRSLRRSGKITAYTGFVTQRAVNVMLAVFLFADGFLGLMLPLGEWIKEKAFGGYLFGNHLRLDDPQIYWQLVGWHTAAGLLPIFCVIMLFVFQPPRSHSDTQPGTFGVS